MKLSKDLVPIIRKKDMDSEATKFLMKYYPEALEKPIPVPVEDIAELQMNIEIDYVNIDKSLETLGMMIFSDGVVELYDKVIDKPIKRNYKKGTLLVERDILEADNMGRERFTIMHEMIHWDKHQLRFMALSYKDKTLAKVCRYQEEKVYIPKTPEEWMEWQADNLAAAVLMPIKMFKKRAEELKQEYEVGDIIDDYECRNYHPNIVRKMIIGELANTFRVSKQAADIRLNALEICILE
ncbi:protein of unknown function [Clostridium cavendishii DSM 21758]|uniref:IrrE N-terminal-like domain-containing protein n=1 Tax=Clostridium cavendishii DSM 21758 TaxID=1121302 RepID=A0A1M6QCB4_9CLOT|nr:ImmA/IrrE family metallo-endopeptidase [Clostridium cavendishii]SHK17821.1 protein of unknown function [Clostridium cavendishii DSM 21758]